VSKSERRSGFRIDGLPVAPEPSETARVVVELHVQDGDAPSDAEGSTEAAHATEPLPDVGWQGEMGG